MLYACLVRRTQSPRPAYNSVFACEVEFPHDAQIE